MSVLHKFRSIALLAALVPLAACGDFLKVTNPGPIEDENLNDQDAFPAIVIGMSADFSVGFDDVIMLNMIAADEMAHGGSYTQPGLFYRGIVRADDVNSEWAAMQRARWVAENGVERMSKVLTEDGRADQIGKDLNIGRGYLWAGLANRVLGENVCEAVIDGGGRQDFKTHFSRAEGHFTEALKVADAAKNATLRNAALGGRAAVRAWQGKWDAAAEDASKVPTAFSFNAVYSSNSSRENNQLYNETHSRFEYTVFNTRWVNVTDDPRVPWRKLQTRAGKQQLGQDGKTPYYQQLKFDDRGSDIPLVKGTEMLLLRAEAALRKNDIAGAVGLINQERAFYKMAPVAPPATLQAAWKLLQDERAAVLWLEGRRFWDLRRWHGDPIPAARTNFLEGRDKCIPISKEELDSNPSLKG